jgi:hypothetical protein
MTRSRPSSPSIRARPQAGRGWALHVAMALVLLFAQTQASLHWLSHSTAAVQSAVRLAKGGTAAATERVTSTMLERVVSIDAFAYDGRSAPASDPGFDLSCDKCASLASLSAMLHSDAFELALQDGRDVQVAARAWSSAERVLRLGYLSRAPPTAG